MTLLLFIRHGLTEMTGVRLSGWTPGLHLSQTGREQAAGLVERLAEAPIAAIYSSPLERCRETVAPLARERGLRVSRDKNLGEVGYGDWTNRPLKQLARTKLWRGVQSQPSSVRFPGGESFQEVQHRILSAARRIADAHSGQTVVLCSHGDPIRLALSQFAGAHLDHFQRFIVSPASVSAVALGEGGPPRMLAVNATEDLGHLFPRGDGSMS